ncbi:MAG: SsrA-binding protein SmpB [Rickettsiales bacterium]|nr:SsrA-binding protein SmpB [Rickettsiales bacterium]
MMIVNKRINFDFNIHQTFEAGIVLTGAEVKSIRKNSVSVNDCYVSINGFNATLLNWNIPKYEQSYRDDKYDPRRPKKLLLHKNEIARITGSMKRDGYTLVIIKCYNGRGGYIKLELALVTAKKKYDKRQYIKEKDARREERKKFAD